MNSLPNIVYQVATHLALQGDAAKEGAKKGAEGADKAAAAAEAAPEGAGVITQYLNDGGFMMWVILGVSIVGTMIFLERVYNLFLLRSLRSHSFMATVLGHIEGRRFRQALDTCEISSKHPLVTVVRSGLMRANRREKDIERAMEKEMLAAMPHLQVRIGFLALLANTATLLGLLGTIFGLIQAFTSVAAASAAERQDALASGISQAMYTTAFGVAVAVPLLFFHHVLSTRAEKIVMEIEGGASALLVALTGVVREIQKPGGPTA
jgi:biopolymer transport protein ExbB/TolQ